MTVFSKFITAMAGLSACLFVLSGLMLTYEVLARYIFVQPTSWAAELSQLCLLWGVLLAAPWCLRERRHIRITAIIGQLKGAPRAASETLSMGVVAVFSAIVGYHGALIVLDSIHLNRTTGTLLNMPIWIVEVAVPAGFALLFAQACIETLRSARGEIVAEGEHE